MSMADRDGFIWYDGQLVPTAKRGQAPLRKPDTGTEGELPVLGRP